MDHLHEITKYISPFLTGLLISTGIGLLIGLEREYTKLHSGAIAGIRTFPIVCITGFLIGHISLIFNAWVTVVSIPAFLLFLGFFHLTQADKQHQGNTTHISLFIAFVLGLMISMELYKESLAVSVVVVTLLALKSRLESALKTITEQELFATIKFFILSLLILPFLPNEDFGPDGILNPYEIGWIVVIISLLNFAGYFLAKFIGSKKGIMATAILGGLVSSTAVAWSLSTRSKESPQLSRTYASGILTASSIMFLRLLVISYIFNPLITGRLWIPFLLMFAVAGGYSWWLIREKPQIAKEEDQIVLGNPLDIVSALSFGLIFILILIAVYYSNLYFGQQGLYFSAIISGLADTDAITISISKLALNINLSGAATLMIVAATLSNTVVKLCIGLFRGHPHLKLKTGIGFGAVLITGLIYILFNILI